MVTMEPESDDLHYWQIPVEPVYLTYPALQRPYTLKTKSNRKINIYQVSRDNVAVI